MKANRNLCTTGFPRRGDHAAELRSLLDPRGAHCRGGRVGLAVASLFRVASSFGVQRLAAALLSPRRLRPRFFAAQRSAMPLASRMLLSREKI
jgi:hypothetical protein